MPKNGMPDGMKTTIYWGIGVGILALTLLILVILFGNLSGNVGFSQDSETVTNNTVTLDEAGISFEESSGKVNAGLSSVTVINASGGETINTGNYTVSGVTIVSDGAEYNGTSVNVSATLSYDSQAQIDSDDVITNYTRSATNVSDNFPTVGTIVGVALLLLILIGILAFAISKMWGVVKVTENSGKFDRGSSGGFA